MRVSMYACEAMWWSVTFSRVGVTWNCICFSICKYCKNIVYRYLPVEQWKCVSFEMWCTAVREYIYLEWLLCWLSLVWLAGADILLNIYWYEFTDLNRTILELKVLKICIGFDCRQLAAAAVLQQPYVTTDCLTSLITSSAVHQF